MIKIRIKGANNSGDRVVDDKEIEYGWGMRMIWIGRGDEIADKQNEDSCSLNLQQFSKAISRIHSIVIFSPSFFTHQPYPTYFNKFSFDWQLNNHLLQLIWQFAKPTKKIILKDLQSKTGVYKKIQSTLIQAGMHIVLGDSRPIIFENEEIYDNAYLMSLRLHQLAKKGYTILNPIAYSQKTTKSFWIISYRSNHFVLFNSISPLITLGRSPDCHLIITEPTISRKHAFLHYHNDHWILFDGDGKNSSSNGTWHKIRKVQLGYNSKDMRIIKGQSYAKLGNILLSFQITEQNEQCISLNRSTKGSLHEIAIKDADELQHMPIMTKGRSHY